jgi:excinuclease UvrABC ATPase subunit
MTLSGSEAHRLKIAAELKVSSAKNGLYLMDEPTPGCTSKTSKKTPAMLQKLVNSTPVPIALAASLL